MKEKLEFILPDWSLSYFINGDKESYSDEELQLMEEFEHDLVEKYNSASIQLLEPIGFRYDNDLSNLGADCSRVFILIEKNN